MKEVQSLLKMLSEGLKTLAQGVEAIAAKVDDAAKTKSAGQAKSKPQPAPAKKAKTGRKKAKAAQKPAAKVVKKPAAKTTTAVDTVSNIISLSSDGVNTAAVMAETGYDQKKVANIVYKLKKQGKIKAVQKGVYVKA